jgi:hypothetical protein
MSRSAKISSGSESVKLPSGVFDILRNEAAHPGKRVHIIASGKKWAVKMAGALRAVKIYDSKDAALKKAKEMIRNGSAESIISHKTDGSFTIVK